MIDRVARTIERYGMLRSGMRVGVGVSGGADSVCLLHVLRELGYELHIVHVDHNLRGEESRADARFVRELALFRQIPCTVREVNLGDGDNLEQAGREARLALFRQLIETRAVDRIALGHTRDDQAETVLFRFLRGAGSAGLAGVRPVTSDGIVRPLIEVERWEVRQYLRERGIEWREDSTNASRQFARNRIRHDLLPQLEREWNPLLRETLAHTAEWARAEEEYWEHELDRLAGSVLQPGIGFVLLRALSLRTLPLAAARRLVRRAVEGAKGNLRGVDFQHIGQVIDLASQAEGHGRVQLPAVEVVRSFDWLRFGKLPERTPYRVPVKIPGRMNVPGTAFEISLEIIEKSETSEVFDCVYNGGMGWLDWRRLSGSLELRNWQPGDRYQPAGSTGEKKIKTLLHEARIPIWERRQWPVLVDGQSVVWTRQFGPASQLAANAGTETVLQIREAEIH